jgi:hypothetical protein
MAAENVLATQITIGLLGSGALQLLKKSSMVTFVTQHSKVFNHVFLLATSAAGAVGIHTAWNGADHSLVITGLDLATIAMSFWIWAKQWAVQYLVHRGAFGAVSGDAPAATLTASTVAGARVLGQMAGGTKPTQRSRLRWSFERNSEMRGMAVALLFIVTFAVVFLFAGCAAGKYNAAQVNQTVTTVIADAGTVAISAEQSYQSGKIPQTAAARTAINDLGAAYNDAKTVYLAVLTAEATYNGSQLAQVTQCQPASSQGGVVPDPAKCAAATQAATAAKSSLDAAQANLTTSLNALTAKTAAVKALSAAQ